MSTERVPISKSEAGTRGAAAKAALIDKNNMRVVSECNQQLRAWIDRLKHELQIAEKWKLEMAQRIVALEQTNERLRAQLRLYADTVAKAKTGEIGASPTADTF